MCASTHFTRPSSKRGDTDPFKPTMSHACACWCADDAKAAMKLASNVSGDVAMIFSALCMLLMFMLTAHAKCVRHRAQLKLVPPPPLYEDATPEQRAEVDNVCCICLDPLQAHDGPRGFVALTCDHDAFHGRCLQNWLMEHDSCPLCRAPSAVTSAETSTTIRSSRDEAWHSMRRARVYG